LNPKKANTFIKAAAKEAGVSEETAKEVVNYYWTRVRNSLSELKHHSIKITNLGTFKIRQTKIALEMKKAQTTINNSDPTEFKNYASYTHATDKLAKLQNLVDLLEDQKSKKQEIKNLRDEEPNRGVEE
jgi:nucleoid DNA-binding protein